MDIRNESGLEFTDISSEEFRRYDFPGDEPVVIDGPCWLHVSESGGHRILDRSGLSHYVAPGWIHLAWKAKDGAPHFVK